MESEWIEGQIGQLESQINITRIVEVKPGSLLLVVCRVDNSGDPQHERVASQLQEKLSELLDGRKVLVIVSDSTFDLDFYRIDQEE